MPSALAAPDASPSRRDVPDRVPGPGTPSSAGDPDVACPENGAAPQENERCWQVENARRVASFRNDNRAHRDSATTPSASRLR